MREKVVRRSVTIPKNLDTKVSALAEKYSYKVKNDLYVELLELGAIKFEEDISFKNMVLNFMNRVDAVLEKLEEPK